MIPELTPPRSAASKLYRARVTRPDEDHTELVENCVADRCGYAVAKLMREYGVARLRPEQVDHLVAVLTGEAVQ